MPTVGVMLEISKKVGRSLEWIATGQEEVTQKIAVAGQKVKAAQEEFGQLPLSISTLTVTQEFLSYIKDASREERETIRRLLRGLKASPDVRTHLIGQLKLIDRLIEQEQAPREDEAADPPSRAQAS